MTWIKYWFALFIIEIFIWAYVIYLHFEEIINRKPKPKFAKEHKVIVKTKRQIMQG